jgi:hypothetical protein
MIQTNLDYFDNSLYPDTIILHGAPCGPQTCCALSPVACNQQKQKYHRAIQLLKIFISKLCLFIYSAMHASDL